MPSPATVCIPEAFEIFANVVKGCHILYAIISRGQKISGIKFSPMIASGKVGENLSPGENFDIIYGILEYFLTDCT